MLSRQKHDVRSDDGVYIRLKVINRCKPFTFIVKAAT